MGQQQAGKQTQGPVQFILLKSITPSKGRPAMADVEGLWETEERSSSEERGGDSPWEKTLAALLYTPNPPFPKEQTTLILAAGQTFGAPEQSWEACYTEPRKKLILTANTLSPLLFTLHNSVQYILFIIKQREKLGFQGV